MSTGIDSRAEKFWDRTAGSYDGEESADGKIFLQIIEKMKGYLKPIDTVLDFGCGTGSFANEISENVKNIHAIDLSSRMIEIARSKAQKQKIKNVEYTKATYF